MPKMTQIQAIVETLKQLGGVATLTQINNHIFEFKDCEWKGKPHSQYQMLHAAQDGTFL